MVRLVYLAPAEPPEGARRNRFPWCPHRAVPLTWEGWGLSKAVSPTAGVMLGNAAECEKMTAPGM